MRTLFLSLQGLSPVSQATESEIMQKCINNGEEVWLLRCGAALRTCRLNPTHNILGCALCTHRCTSEALRMGVPAQRILQLDETLFPETLEVELPENLNELMEFTHDGVNVGRGAASTTISFLRDYNLKPRGEHKAIIELQLLTAIGAARNYQRILDEVRPDEVIIYNGRHIQAFPMVDLCRKRKISFKCFEFGCRVDRYHLFIDTTPHSIVSRQATMFEMWDQTEPTVRISKAIAWYENKRGRIKTNDKVYTAGQDVGKLPPGFDLSTKNIAIFNSSEDEMKTIQEWKTDLFDSQNEAIRSILEATKDDAGLHFYLRVHPNLKDVKNDQMKELLHLAYDHLTIIPPENQVDSYALVDAADAVVTFGSSIGLEASYWEKPSILYGKSFYQGLDAVYEPANFKELLSLIRTPDLPPKPSGNALPFAYYIDNYGTPFKYSRVVSENKVWIKGKYLGRFSFGMLWNLISLLPQLNRWLKAHRIFSGRGLRWKDIFKIYS